MQQELTLSIPAAKLFEELPGSSCRVILHRGKASVFREGMSKPVEKYCMLFSDALLTSKTDWGESTDCSEWGCDVELICLLKGATLTRDESAGSLPAGFGL